MARVEHARTKAPPPTVGSCWIESENAPHVEGAANSGWWLLPTIVLGGAIWVIVFAALTLNLNLE